MKRGKERRIFEREAESNGSPVRPVMREDGADAPVIQFQTPVEMGDFFAERDSGFR